MLRRLLSLIFVLPLLMLVTIPVVVSLKDFALLVGIVSKLIVVAVILGFL
ncbi:MAG: hypothetical protein ACUVTR_00025 [Dehalococcoidia bacterium]